MTTATTKLTKQDLARMLAKAMNLLGDVHNCDSMGDDAWTTSQKNELNALIHMLPEITQEHYFNGWTLDAKDLGMKTK